MIFNLGMHFIVGQEIVYFCNNTVYGASQWAVWEVLLLERAMTALMKSKPRPVVFAVIEIEKRKIVFVKNEINPEIDIC
jgi:hypothetical protein